jgi:phosphate transport system permease protein
VSRTKSVIPPALRLLIFERKKKMNEFAPIQSATTAKFAGRQFGDRAFKWLTLLMALSIFVLIALIGFELFNGSKLALQKFGWHFLVTNDWDPVNEVFGAVPFIFGTLVSSGIALIVAVPISIATAVYITELAPLWLRQPLITFIELLAAVPSVILGLWGIFVMIPFLSATVFPWLQKFFGFLPLFKGPILGSSMLAGGIIVAIMIIPIITSVSREILRSVPGLQREAAYALGATRWEVTRIAVLSYAKKGLFGAVILGLGRALGETMAVTMVIGNTPQIVSSLFAPGYTLASVIANEFTEATGNVYLSALFELGLVLLGVTVVVNIIAQLLLKTFAGPTVKPQH